MNDAEILLQQEYILDRSNRLQQKLLKFKQKWSLITYVFA